MKYHGIRVAEDSICPSTHDQCLSDSMP